MRRLLRRAEDRLVQAFLSPGNIQAFQTRHDTEAEDATRAFEFGNGQGFVRKGQSDEMGYGT